MDYTQIVTHFTTAFDIVNNTSQIHTLKCDYFYIFLFSFEAKIFVPKGKLTRLQFNQTMIRISGIATNLIE